MGSFSDNRGTSSTHYQILGRLAVGGMAEIYAARARSQVGIERYVVIKRVLPNLAADNEFVQMFLDEARLAAQLHHPNIAAVFDVGKLGGSYFFAMEYVHGATVRTLAAAAAQRQQPMPLQHALTIAEGAAAGLHHAHERRDSGGRSLGVVHRDVSPANLMVSYEGVVKVVDFGIAKASQRSVSETEVGAVKGKVSYMSPEQCRGEAVDRRSDVFSLGIVMHELLTGRRLFRMINDFETMTAIVHGPIERPSSRIPGLPPIVDEVVMTALAKEPERRFATASAFAEALEQAAVACGVALSERKLARYLVDLVGEQPEPWARTGSTLPGVEVPEKALTIDLTSESSILSEFDEEFDRMLRGAPRLGNIDAEFAPPESGRPLHMTSPYAEVAVVTGFEPGSVGATVPDMPAVSTAPGISWPGLVNVAEDPNEAARTLLFARDEAGGGMMPSTLPGMGEAGHRPAGPPVAPASGPSIAMTVPGHVRSDRAMPAMADVRASSPGLAAATGSAPEISAAVANMATEVIVPASQPKLPLAGPSVGASVATRSPSQASAPAVDAKSTWPPLAVSGDHAPADVSAGASLLNAATRPRIWPWVLAVAVAIGAGAAALLSM